MNNVLLVIVDCLRYDYVTEERMPFLWKFGQDHLFFTNYWATSHCTDPCITHMLTGRHPDELRLYSMLYEHKNYSIPDDIGMLSETAQRLGYDTGFVTNMGRWYKRGVRLFVDCRSWPGTRIFGAGRQMVAGSLSEPWFLVVHTDDMHRNCTGGSYLAAAGCVDRYIKELISLVDLEKTVIFITSDHGEGLGEKGIQQHGYGLWDFLTHVPLIASMPLRDIQGMRMLGAEAALMDHGSLYRLMNAYMHDWKLEIPAPKVFKNYVFQAGDTPPNIRHRGVVYPDGFQYIWERRGDDIQTFKVPAGSWKWVGRYSEWLLDQHCKSCGIDHFAEMSSDVERRLKGLGYFN